MSKAYLFYNPLAGQGKAIEDLKLLEAILDADDLIYCDMTQGETYSHQLFSLTEDDCLVLCGGDGTLNRFLNLIDISEIPCEILYFPIGTGNDFAHDLGYRYESNPFPVKEYFQNLPTVMVQGKKYRFLNAVGFGLDGYCCEEGDKLRQESEDPVNYTKIAIKGLLGAFQPRNATITVDGVTHTYKKVWIAPTMHGRYYGGGMKAVPSQNRESGELSVMVWHGSSKLGTLVAFPGIFKGTHIKHKKHIAILTGKTITVTFDRPAPLQIDGETIADVLTYTATIGEDIT